MTHNTERLNDPEYLGWRHERIIGQDYFDFEQIHPARETCEGWLRDWLFLCCDPKRTVPLFLAASLTFGFVSRGD